MESSDRGDLHAAVRSLQRLGVPRTGRVLVLGRPGLSPPDTQDLPFQIEAPNDPDDWDLADDRFDAAIVLDALEWIEWDRWRLQEVHRVLRSGGHLALGLPSRDFPPSLGTLGFMVHRALGRLARRFSGAPRRFQSHRYRAAELHEQLLALHFEVLSWNSHRFVEPSGERTIGPSVTPFADRHFILARRAPTFAERIRKGTAPAPVDFIRTYEAEHARFHAIRQEWSEAHPSERRGAAIPLDPGSLAGARVLVLAPHADDELVGSAGTLLRLIEHGAEVRIIHATDGSAGAALRFTPEPIRTTIRLDEARRVGAALGAKHLDFWRQDNRAFHLTRGTVALMRAVLEEFAPQIIMTPFVTDIHPDHFTLNEIMEQALTSAGPALAPAEIWYSEIWSLVPCNLYCDVTAQEPEVERLIRLYTTAMKIDDLPHICESRYYYNACRLLRRPGFVEAFHRISASRHGEYMSSARALHD